MVNITDILKEKNIEVYLNEPMKNHTTFKVGGPADIFVMPKDAREVKFILDNAGSLPITLIGNGSNMLVSDKGIEGIVICFDNMKEITVLGNKIKAQSGALISSVAAIALENELTGMEFAAGIPCKVCGAAFMNAGAYGGEIKDIIKTVTVIENGEIKKYDVSECGYGYRKSVFMGSNSVILEAEFELKKGNREEIAETMRDLAARRRDKQPLEFPSAGSTFKRPEGHFAGALIENAGLKGLRVGDAEVSEKHAGFIINRGSATANDILELINEVKRRVYEHSGVMLEEEVRLIGRR